MRIVCTADLHEHLVEIPPCDLLLIAGDLTFAFGGASDKRGFLTGPFAEWLVGVPATDIVVVAGNHDREVQDEGFPSNLCCHYLEDAAIDVGGVKVWGTPWQPWFYDWAFNAPRIDGERFLDEKFELIADGTDIIVCHGPPLGYGDRTPVGNVGSKALTAAIDRVQPRLVVCGHIHEDPGCFRRGPTEIVNASLVDHTYSPVNPPVTLDF